MTSPGTSLRHNRIKIALWVAVAEGLLTLVGVIPHWVVYGLAVVALVYLFTERDHGDHTVSQ